MKDEFLKYLAFTVFGSWISIQVSIGILKSQVGRLEKDLDNIALILGTKKAIGKNQQKKEKT